MDPLRSDATPDARPAPLTLWLVDRSRYEEGTSHCQRARFLRYHAGDHGYGWDKKAQSIPTVTGTLIHGPITAIAGYMRDHDAIPDGAWIAEHAINPAVREYHRVANTRGLGALMDAETLAFQIMEQVTLLEGLVWAWVRGPLPAYHAQNRVLLVEEEFVSVIGCTCGLGDLIGRAEDHDARGCHGLGWMTRGDVIAEARETKTLRYDEFKSTSVVGMNWEAAWFHRVQLVAGVLGAEQALGRTIDEVYIHALLKGRRGGEWNPEEGKASGAKYQQSPLVYGGRRAANPPAWDEQWAAKWAGQYYWDEIEQRRRKMTKEFPRTGIWELPAAQWQQGDSTSPSDYWTRWIPEDVLLSQYKCVGPIYRKPWKLEAFLGQLVGEERRWQDALWQLYEASDEGRRGWAHPEMQALLDRLVPQTRGDACESFFGDKCPFLSVCERYEGWEDPAAMGYIQRRPHHTPELQQMIARGLALPDAGAVDEAEE